MSKKDDTSGSAKELAARLMRRHCDIEDRCKKGTDWSLARELKDRIGSYQSLAGDFDRAEQLLGKHGF